LTEILSGATGDSLLPEELDGDAIASYLKEVAEAIPRTSDQYEIVVVGGSLLALLGYRESTRDIDSVTRLEQVLRDAVTEVARRHGLSPAWLNDSAAQFLPQTFNKDDCSLILDHPRLRVLGAPLQQVFLMKVLAARSRDITDLEISWTDCGFESPEQAAASFHEAYPHEEYDSHLADWIRRRSN
jgi:hypothetical protein